MKNNKGVMAMKSGILPISQITRESMDFGLYMKTKTLIYSRHKDTRESLDEKIRKDITTWWFSKGF